MDKILLLSIIIIVIIINSLSILNWHGKSPLSSVLNNCKIIYQNLSNKDWSFAVVLVDWNVYIFFQ